MAARVVIELLPADRGGLGKPQPSGTRSLPYRFDLDGEVTTHGAFLDLDDECPVAPGTGPVGGVLTLWAETANRISVGDQFDIVYPTRLVGHGHVESLSTSSKAAGATYERFADLSRVLLEDSWVTDLAPSESVIAFRLSVALLPGHTMYTEPEPGELHCYRTGWLSVAGTAPVTVALTGAPPAAGASGTSDLGHIDRFEETEPGVWELEGDWGTATIRAPHVTLTLQPAVSPEF